MAFTKLKKLFTAPPPKPTIEFRTRLFNAMCLSVLLYGCETWVLTKALVEELDVFARKCYRTMLGIRQADAHTTNEELYRLTKQHPVSVTIRKRQLEFVGHCLRMEENKLAYIYAIYHSDVSDKNKRGAPRLTFRYKIRSYIDEYNISQKARNQIALPVAKSSQSLTHVEREEETKVINSITKNRELWKHIVELHTRGPNQ